MFWSTEQVEGMLNMLKTSTDRTVIYKCLVKLRTDLVKDKTGIELFRTSGGIPVMVSLTFTSFMSIGLRATGLHNIRSKPQF